MNFNDLTHEQQEKAQNCKTPEETLALAKQEGYELSDEELDQISAGAWFATKTTCPSCQSTNISPQGMHSYKCLDCKHLFSES